MKLTKRENDLADFASERIEVLQKKLVTVMEENEGLKNDVDIRGKKIEELRKKNENLLKDIVRHADSATALAKERDRLQDSLKAAACVNDSLSEEIGRLKAQNVSFVEEQREAKKRAASMAADMALAREEVARLVRLNDDFRERLQKVTTEKNQILEISNGFARERDEIRAEYDARGKVIKKLRKRLHKLKKKLKH